ncbi:MAG TPA: hypothetical protein VGL22_13335 [Terracidiphilus sp.]
MTKKTKNSALVRRSTPPAARAGPRVDKAEVVIARLLRGGRLTDVARETNIGYATLREWLASEWFRTQYQAARRQLLDATIDKLRSVGSDAVELLYRVMMDPKKPTTPRVGAARSLLEVLLRAVETQDLSERLEHLEAAVKEANEGH